MSRKVKIGLIGAGVFGGYHANKLAAHPRIDFIGLYDHDAARAKEVAAKHSVRVFAGLRALYAKVDALVIACPARYHGDIAINALKAGKHCLIEKPIAPTLAQAETIHEFATDTSLVVQIGHQERFVAKAIGLDTIPERPLSLNAQRLGPPSGRGGDVSVTLDLMTHDLDLVLMLMGHMPDSVRGQTRAVDTPFSDETLAHLTFGSAQVTLKASRLAPAFTRTMDIKYPSGDVHIDFNAKTMRHSTPFDLNENFADDPIAQDSLGAATNSFVQAILDGMPVMITAQDGYNALKLALQIDGDMNGQS